MSQIVILAGGLGTRLYPITKEIPKSLVQIQGEPFIHWQLLHIKNNGIKNVVMCLSHKADQIVDYLGNGSKYGIDIQYSFDGQQQLGTGGAILNAIDKLHNDFFVIYGDSYLQIDFQEAYRVFRESKQQALMTYIENFNKLHKNNIGIDQHGNFYYDKKVSKINMSYIDYGLSILKKEIFFGYSKKERFDLSDLLNNLSMKNLVAWLQADIKFHEIGSQEGIKEFSDFIEQEINSGLYK